MSVSGPHSGGATQAPALEHWSSHYAFIMAAVGSAVGLGNIWKFPYMTGTNGGGAFVLVYLACVVTIGLPILLAELLVGRHGGASPVGALMTLGRRHSGHPAWGLLGAFGAVAGLLILSFYSVVAGWALSYVVPAADGRFVGADAAATGAAFEALLSQPWTLFGWHSLFMALTAVIVARGVKSGLERASLVMMPMLMVILLVLVAYAAVAGDFARGAAFLFTPDFGKLSAAAVLAAVGHAFFTLSLGLGSMMAYGAYLPQNISIPRSAVTVSVLDTTCALAAGLAIFPIVFALGMDPAAGPGLVFVTLPAAFGAMPAGNIFGMLFFLLLAFAALTSAVALLEPMVAVVTERLGGNRPLWTFLIAGATWLLGLVSVLSFNVLSGFHPLGRGWTVFDLLDKLTTNWMLPLGGAGVALFVGWVLPKAVSAEELGLPPALHRWWLLTVRFAAPAAMLAIMFQVVL